MNDYIKVTICLFIVVVVPCPSQGLDSTDSTSKSRQLDFQRDLFTPAVAGAFLSSLGGAVIIGVGRAIESSEFNIGGLVTFSFTSFYPLLIYASAPGAAVSLWLHNRFSTIEAKELPVPSYGGIKVHALFLQVFKFSF